MSPTAVRDEIVSRVEQLPLEKQQMVLDFVRQMSAITPSGTPGQVLLEQMDQFIFAPDALDEMAQAIADDCERIDGGEW